jgi:hypothetical protein
MLRKLRKLAQISPDEWLLLPQLFALCLVVGVALRLVELPRLIGFITQCAKNRWLNCLPFPHARCGVVRLTIFGDLATRVTHGQKRCLIRSLLLLWLFKARGEPAELLIGVSKEASALNSHAWIETRGSVVSDSQEMTGRFATLLRF